MAGGEQVPLSLAVLVFVVLLGLLAAVIALVRSGRVVGLAARDRPRR